MRPSAGAVLEDGGVGVARGVAVGVHAVVSLCIGAKPPCFVIVSDIR